MSFFLEEVVTYRCRCDYCGRVADEHRSSRNGDRWSDKKWARLRKALLRLGWRSKKTGVCGHSHSPVYRWACPECAYKIETEPHEVIEEKTA